MGLATGAPTALRPPRPERANPSREQLARDRRSPPHEARPTVDEARVDLHERGAGADLRVRVLRAHDATRAHDRHAPGGARGAAAHDRGREPLERRAERPPASLRARVALHPGAREGRVRRDDPGDPRRDRDVTASSSASGARSGASFTRSGFPGARSASRATHARRSRSSWSVSWSCRSPGVFGEEMFTTR